MDPSQRKITKIARNAANFSQRQLKAFGLGTSEYDVLHCIRKNPGIILFEICGELGMEKSAAAHCIASLEAKGYICRKTDPEDKRRKQLFPLEKADELKDQRASREADFYAWLMEDIPPEKLDVFLEVLDTIYQKSKDARHTQYRDVAVPEKG